MNWFENLFCSHGPVQAVCVLSVIIAIGLGLGLVNIVGIPVDNCSVNPARSFGPAVFDPTAWGDFWIMVVGPAIGAVLAVLCWVAMAGGRKAIK